MAVCSFRYTDIVRVEFFRDSTSVIKFSKPFVVYDPLISVTSDVTDTTKDCMILADPEFVVNIDNDSGSLTVNASTDVAGTKYKNVLEYDYEWLGGIDSTAFRQQLVNLQRNNYHLRITYLGGSQHIIRSDESSWLYDYKESKGKPQVTITIENICGAQRVV